MSSASLSRSARASTAFRAIAASCTRSSVVSSGSTIVSRSCSASSARCFRRLMSFLASSLTRLVATANSQARSFCIEVCLKARTNVSCDTSSYQSRSPRSRVRYLTNAALYVRKSRSTSVTRSPAVPQQCQVAISQLLFSGWSQLDCHAATCYNHTLTHGKGLAQFGHHLEQLEVCIREWLQLQHGSGFLVAHIRPKGVAEYEGHVVR